ncbi:MAG: DUF4388 domain-containing protein [Thermoanaerobaculia bacterium]
MVHPEGHLQGVSLPSFLQMLASEGKSCVLHVADGTSDGELHFRDGELVDARLGSASGVEAAYAIVRWDLVDVQVLPRIPSPERTIHEPLHHVLLEGHRRADEEARGAGAAGPPETAAAVAEVPAAGVLTPPGKEKSLSLQDLIDRFAAEVPHFVSTDVVDIESGLSIGGASADPTFDAAAAAASYAEVVKANRQTAELLGLGREATEDILITLRDFYVLLRMLGSDYYQGLAVARAGNLGLARAVMKKYEKAFTRFVGGLKAT